MSRKDAAGVTAVAAAIMLISVLCGCGIDSADEARVPEPSGPQVEMGHRISIPDGARRRRGESACTHVDVALGDHPGTIDIRARCFGVIGGGPVSFFVQRDSSTGGRPRLELRGFWRHPRIYRAGRRSVRKGRCRAGGDALGCVVGAEGRILADMRLWVAPGTECAFPFAVMRNASTCRSHTCLAVYSLRQLFLGRPSGCPA